MSRRFRIPKRSRLVVVYYGTDALYHRRSRTDPRRPACRPILDPGILTDKKKAEAEGKVPCPECWADQTPNETRA